MSLTPLPHPRRIVTGHDDQGKAIFLADSRIPLEVTKLGASLGVLWETKKVPADNSGKDDPATSRTTDLANKSGVVLRVVDIEPGQDALPQDRVARLWDSVRWSSLMGWCCRRIAAEPVKVGDKVLGAHGYHKDDVATGGAQEV
ncbi:hypothetical protein FOPE_04474 [Fonsecaea pedrosoi]|nr:hypothetical protein FOPE_04474 [Fonsecaea pedrosoi]